MKKFATMLLALLLTALFLLGLATGLLFGGLGGGECRGLAGRLFLGEQLGRFLGQGVVPSRTAPMPRAT